MGAQLQGIRAKSLPLFWPNFLFFFWLFCGPLRMNPPGPRFPKVKKSPQNAPKDRILHPHLLSCPACPQIAGAHFQVFLTLFLFGPFQVFLGGCFPKKKTPKMMGGPGEVQSRCRAGSQGKSACVGFGKGSRRVKGKWPQGREWLGVFTEFAVEMSGQILLQCNQRGDQASFWRVNPCYHRFNEERTSVCATAHFDGYGG